MYVYMSVCVCVYACLSYPIKEDVSLVMKKKILGLKFFY